MIAFLSGTLTLAYIIAAAFFLRFWRRSSDPLFLNFALAFYLFALNQFLVSVWGAADERTGYSYILRVLGFILILFAIVGKNLVGNRGGK